MHRFFYLALVILSIGLVPPARAQKLVCPKASADPEKNKVEARRYYNMGGVYFNMNDFEKSAESFLCVLTLVPYSLMARYQLARSYDKMGKYELARQHYKWVSLDPSEEAKTLHEEVKKRLDELKGLPDKTPVATDPESLIHEEAKKKAEAARLAQEKAERDEQVRRDLEARQKREAELAAKKKLEEEALQRERERLAKEKAGKNVPPLVHAEVPLMSRWWFWTGIAATAAFTITATFTGLRVLDLNDKWDHYNRDGDREDLLRYRTYTDLALGGALVSAGALAFTIWQTSKPSTRSSIRTTDRFRLLPSCGPGACGLTFSWDF